MRDSNILYCENGVIKFRADDGAYFKLSINGRPADGSIKGVYRATEFDARTLSADAYVAVAVFDADGARIAEQTAVYRAAQKQLAPPAADVRVCGETLEWDQADGATAYRVIDLDYNVTTVTETYYDMSDKNLVLAVYPVIPGMPGALVAPCRIKYLQGEGTTEDPYRIRTPFDVRAVDYYEFLYAYYGGLGARNVYRVETDIDYAQVFALESESNMFMLKKPFFGRFDGNGKALRNVSVEYDGGSWAMFEFIADGGEIKDVVFDSPTVFNRVQVCDRPIDASVAAVAYINHGTVCGVTVKHASFTAAGGAVAGAVLHNYGKVVRCKVSGTLRQAPTGQPGQACYEMAGVVLENLRGGVVDGNIAVELSITGSTCRGECGDGYFNVRTAGGIVAVNRAGGTVINNGYISLNMSGMTENCTTLGANSEWGGIVAYNAGTVACGYGETGVFKWNGFTVPTDRDCGYDCMRYGDDILTDRRGSVIGKNDGVYQCRNGGEESGN